MQTELGGRSIELVVELGLMDKNDIMSVTPLTGGVASDIAVIEGRTQKLCAKFALPQMKVAEDWQAPVHRNKAEYLWLQSLAEIAPNNCPKLFGRSEKLGGFIMEFIEGDNVFVWKANLLNRVQPRGEAGKLGDLLAKIHINSSQPAFDKANFDNQVDFEALRISPYLQHLKQVHPDLVDEIEDIIEMLRTHQKVLVHGDISPKNILFRDGQPIILDAECATFGDPAFDAAFCLSHLILKAIHVPDMQKEYIQEAHRFWDFYAIQANWESGRELEQRVARLLPALMLARVDGKSPVEYLGRIQQGYVRALAISLLKRQTDQLSDVFAAGDF
jgi:aminoglycoside phosphotransferase (APT) family kinase protein